MVGVAPEDLAERGVDEIGVAQQDRFEPGLEPGQLLVDCVHRQHVAVHAQRVVLDEPEVERGDRGDCAGDSDRAKHIERRRNGMDVRADRVDVLAEALGHPH